MDYRCDGPKLCGKLLLIFEAGDLFVQMTLMDLTSADEAHAVLERGVSLALHEGWIYLDCPGRERQGFAESEDHADFCGRWTAGADRRRSIDDLLDSALTVQEFFALQPQADLFRMAYFHIQEWYREEHGPWRQQVSMSGCTDKLVEHPQSLSKYPLAG